MERHNRSILGRKEIDIYVPAAKVGVEYNGIYWHTERVKGSSTYHYDKWAAAKAAGVRLVQIWEDDWQQRPHLVKAALAQALGVALPPVVLPKYGIQVVNLKKTEANSWLTAHTLQALDPQANTWLGIHNAGAGLVFVIAGRLEDGAVADGIKQFTLTSHAATALVPGGLEAVLTYLTVRLGVNKVEALVDNLWADAILFERDGFTAVGQAAPRFEYVLRAQRYPVTAVTPTLFRKQKKLLWAGKMSVEELVDLNGVDRLWDAGYTRMVPTV